MVLGKAVAGVVLKAAVFVAVGVVAAAVCTAAVVAFWDKIEKWLNKYAATIVEKVFGYKASNNMKRAIVRVGRVVDVIKQRTTIFVKRDPLDEYMIKTEVEAEAPIASIDEEVLREIREKGEIAREFEAKYVY